MWRLKVFCGVAVTGIGVLVAAHQVRGFSSCVHSIDGQATSCIRAPDAFGHCCALPDAAMHEQPNACEHTRRSCFFGEQMLKHTGVGAGATKA